MTADHIHDALTLLPADLLAGTDALRTSRPKIIPWRKYAAMAACLLLVLGSGALVLNRDRGTKEMAAESLLLQSAEPAAAAPMEEAAPAQDNSACLTEEAMKGCPTAPASATSGSGTHTHSPAESAASREEPAPAYAGEITVTAHPGGQTYILTGEEAAAVVRLLEELSYESDATCRCMAEYTVDTETAEGYQISLTNSFVRFSGAQAALTREQTDRLRQLLENSN